jgi:hypothetical protein
MSEPVGELIAANIKTTLDGVTEDSGYTFDATVYRPIRLSDTQSILDGTIWLLQETAQVDEDEPQGRMQVVQTWTAYIEVVTAKGSTTPSDTIGNRRAADVHEALMVDATRGGHAIDTMVGPPEVQWSEEVAIYAVSIAVRYRTDYDDPRTAG